MHRPCSCLWRIPRTVLLYMVLPFSDIRGPGTPALPVPLAPHSIFVLSLQPSVLQTSERISTAVGEPSTACPESSCDRPLACVHSWSLLLLTYSSFWDGRCLGPHLEKEPKVRLKSLASRVEIICVLNLSLSAGGEWNKLCY